ncbi:MAG TPA: hypothetical protein VIL46_13590 [Gemmataceae bacterium]
MTTPGWTTSAGGHYSRWFRRVIKDELLTGKAAGVERMVDVSTPEGRRLIAEANEEHDTHPA